jgi:hypothetical protein
MDKGYDAGRIYDGCEGRDYRPIIPLRKTPAVHKSDHKPPTCEHGTWTFAGADYQRKATKWRCPTGVQARFPVGQGRSAAPRWSRASRTAGPPCTGAEGAVEREFGRLKNEWALSPLRFRGLDRVRLHADLTILAKLACAQSGASRVARGLAAHSLR